MTPCPENYRPGCTCYSGGLEPNDDCYYHGFPDTRQCPHCGLFRGRRPCKRCGCVYGLEERESTNPVNGATP